MALMRRRWLRDQSPFSDLAAYLLLYVVVSRYKLGTAQELATAVQ